MLSLELIPGKSAGFFVLGMSVSEAIAFIQQKNKVISHAELKYNELDPIATDILLDLNEDGVMLRFEPKTQKLKSIIIYDVTRVILLYNKSVFNSPEEAPTLVSTSETFGLTHPGEYDPTTQIYYLHYPGLSFTFPIPKKYEALYMNSNEIPPMEFPNRTTPVANKIFIYVGNKIQTPELPPHPIPNSLYFEETIVKIGSGVEFIGRKSNITFESTSQDVISELGPPNKIFYKEEDKMKIHTSSYNGLGCQDYFYNYFNSGIDVLFDIRTHKAKKFILHTNFPSHHEFNRYVKCNFRIKVSENSEPLDEEEGVLESKKVKQVKKTSYTITPDSKWSEIQQVLGSPGKPVVHNKGSNANPFGPTLFYGYKGIIFEVMQNNYIASVCIFAS